MPDSAYLSLQAHAALTVAPAGAISRGLVRRQGVPGRDGAFVVSTTGQVHRGIVDIVGVAAGTGAITDPIPGSS